MERDERATAYHEAGHMCVAWDLGLSVTGATIVPDPDEGTLGYVRCPIEDRVRYALWVDEDEYLFCHLAVYFAGVAASEKYTGVPTPPEAVQLSLGSYGSDHYNAGDLIVSLAGSDPDKQVEVSARAQRLAENLVEVHWERIETVAGVLVQRKTLDETECRQVLEGRVS